MSTGLRARPRRREGSPCAPLSPLSRQSLRSSSPPRPSSPQAQQGLATALLLLCREAAPLSRGRSSDSLDKALDQPRLRGDASLLPWPWREPWRGPTPRARGCDSSSDAPDTAPGSGEPDRCRLMDAGTPGIKPTVGNELLGSATLPG
eukprot:357700-Chlamydomonas_euryale.AAC.3